MEKRLKYSQPSETEWIDKEMTMKTETHTPTPLTATDIVNILQRKAAFSPLSERARLVRAVNRDHLFEELLSALKACHLLQVQQKHASYSGSCSACVAIAKAEAQP